jgi:hypothetical protein
MGRSNRAEVEKDPLMVYKIIKIINSLLDLYFKYQVLQGIANCCSFVPLDVI